jgi:predicted MFS family arabinose efflux permease
MSEQKASHFRWQLVAIMVGRLFVNTGMRMVYPFAPAFARGMGVPLTAVYQVIALRNITGFFSPLFSPLSERFGRKAVMMGSLALFAGSCLLVVVWPTFWTFALAMALLGLAKVNYDPSMQAYVGDAVPYAQRGKALAVTEYSWALALLIGAPAVGLAIQAWGWSAPFFWLGLLLLLAALLLWRTLPRLGKRRRQRLSLRNTLRVVAKNRVVWAAFVYITLVMTANEILFIVYGDWMERSFGLTLATLGLASAIIGGSEIIGETFAGWSVDRFGKRQVVILAGVANGLLYAVLPFTSLNLTTALITLFALFMMFEITVVGGMPLMTELVPKHRAVVMSVVVAAMSVGRTVGAFVGPAVLAWGGFVGSGAASALVMGTAVFVLARWVWEGGEDDQRLKIED